MHLPTRNTAIFILFISILLSACGNNLWGTYEQYLTPTAESSVATLENPIFTPTPIASPTTTPPPLIVTEIVPPSMTPTLTPNIIQNTTVPGSVIPYTSQSGDSLNVVAIHFGINPTEISSSATLPATGFINPGTLLFLHMQPSPAHFTSSQRIIPDSELVDSPSAVGFDLESFVKKAGGNLSTFTDFHTPVGTLSGLESVKMISVGSSISPRLLLALIQYYTGWVQGGSIPGLDESHLFDYDNPSYNPATPTLYQPMRLVVQDLLTGYYGWRTGNLSQLTFPDGMTLRIAPDQNAGSVALQYFFSKHLNYNDWQGAINPDTGFPALYESMFGDPWERAKPLFPPNLIQPTFTLPFEIGAPWNFTYGPHPAWEAESTLGALDFAPSGVSGCSASNAWVVAISSGQIVRSESSYVVLDQNPDGLEQTGWVVIYQHISTKDRIPVGTFVEAGTHIGHPSCEGGTANGTHIHIARKYNGEWVAASGPLPFVLSGWTTHAGYLPGEGTLTKDDKVITASPVSEGFSKIIRLPGE